MPYIKQEDREKFRGQWGLQGLVDLCGTPGEFNYMLTNLVIGYVKNRGESYTTYNEVVGVLECVKAELMRRRIADYEDLKADENGDVY